MSKKRTNIMSKALTLTLALVAAAATPALAADQASTNAFTAQLSANANAKQVRQILLSQNYTRVSNLNRGQDGRWTGTAVKNGKATSVSVYLPAKAATTKTN